MVGKGRRRREKNYRAAHGGPSRLPPPPDPSQVDALPSKLRQLISYTSPRQGSTESQKKNSFKANADINSRQKKRDIINAGDDNRPADSDNEIGKKKKKRKRKDVKDLRFEAVMEDSATRSKRKERKKKYLEAKKKKHKKAETDEQLDFPGREHIKFGDVVEAPPKFTVPKAAFKTNASQERLRLQAIKAYRARRKWTSRLGVQLPLPTAPSL